MRALTSEEQNNEKEKVRAALLAAQAPNRWWRGCELFCGRMWDDHQHGGQARIMQRTRGIHFPSMGVKPYSQCLEVEPRESLIH